MVDLPSPQFTLGIDSIRTKSAIFPMPIFKEKIVSLRNFAIVVLWTKIHLTVQKSSTPAVRSWVKNKSSLVILNEINNIDSQNQTMQGGNCAPSPVLVKLVRIRFGNTDRRSFSTRCLAKTGGSLIFLESPISLSLFLLLWTCNFLFFLAYGLAICLFLPWFSVVAFYYAYCGECVLASISSVFFCYCGI